mmetsp:Transcript_27046/g.59827  ORF Transcript_27046/g.59827 Transcript_27046/m.59827 type:complete len:218 (-) Transcript_27046:349-1002(-)
MPHPYRAVHRSRHQHPPVSGEAQTRHGPAVPLHRRHVCAFAACACVCESGRYADCGGTEVQQVHRTASAATSQQVIGGAAGERLQGLGHGHAQAGQTQVHVVEHHCAVQGDRSRPSASQPQQHAVANRQRVRGPGPVGRDAVLGCEASGLRGVQDTVHLPHSGRPVLRGGETQRAQCRHADPRHRLEVRLKSVQQLASRQLPAVDPALLRAREEEGA